MFGDMNPGTEPTDLLTRIIEHKYFCDTVWRQDHLSMSLACRILTEQVLGYRSQMKRPLRSDTYNNTFTFSVSNLCESIPLSYFITGYNIGTTAAELKEYSKCFVNPTHRPLTDRMLLVIQWQCNDDMSHTDFTLNVIHWEDMHHALLQYIKHYLSAQDRKPTLQFEVNYSTFNNTFSYLIHSISSWCFPTLHPFCPL